MQKSLKSESYKSWGHLLLVTLSWSCWFRPSNWSIRWFNRLFSSRCVILSFSRLRFPWKFCQTMIFWVTRLPRFLTSSRESCNSCLRVDISTLRLSLMRDASLMAKSRSCIWRTFIGSDMLRLTKIIMPRKRANS